MSVSNIVLEDISNLLTWQAEDLRDHIEICSSKASIVQRMKEFEIPDNYYLGAVMQVNKAKKTVRAFVAISPECDPIRKVVQETLQDKFLITFVEEIDPFMEIGPVCLLDCKL